MHTYTHTRIECVWNDSQKTIHNKTFSNQIETTVIYACKKEQENLHYLIERNVWKLKSTYFSTYLKSNHPEVLVCSVHNMPSCIHFELPWHEIL